MKSLSLGLVLVIALSGCTSRQSDSARSIKPKLANDAEGHFDALKGDPKSQSLDQIVKDVSLESTIDRKIIRDANLTIEVKSTTDAQQQITNIAESHGGFVVASEAKQRENVDPAKRTTDIKLVIRVPSPRFGEALDQIEKLALNLPERNVTGQDVTEEFIDLEARLKTQKALELQFLEIMKQARKVEDALEVQRQVADVRTEIEKLEGRKRFLESRSSLSTITVNIQTPRPIVVSASGFVHTAREAASESLDLATAMILFFIRFVIVLAPLFVFVVLPIGLIALYFRRRATRLRLAHDLEANPVTD